MKRRSTSPWLYWLPAVVLCAGSASGCGYMLGSAYGPQIRTVEVPIFQNDTFRRGIEYQLTEAVQKEIQNRTPYRLAKGADADTRLSGRIVDLRKDVLGETNFDDPRELQVSLAIRVTWEDLRNGQILAQEVVPVGPDVLPLVGQAEFAPEVGQSLATATRDAVQRLAGQIVNMMEVPW
uniref:LptE family protein n=1 Tax=Schlesneria paludicola TaxID=360056 RepID=A0A7C4QM13_9PLAN